MTKNELKDLIAKSNGVSITFKKMDGSLRTLVAAPPNEIPPKPMVELNTGADASTYTPPKHRPEQDHLIRVYSVADGGWRSVVLDNIISVDGVSW